MSLPHLCGATKGTLCEFLPSCFLLSVLLTGGIVGVAGQFRGWEFAAYAVYPFHLNEPSRFFYQEKLKMGLFKMIRIKMFHLLLFNLSITAQRELMLCHGL